MKTIEESINSEYIVKNSKFITYLFPLESEDISSYLNEIKKIHPKANHYCYAYIYKDIYHYSDDLEPSNTAGLPMYMVLEKNNLSNILVIVVRYFGGIKLGAGGLVRAYTKALTSTLENCKYINLALGYLVLIKIDYDEVKNLDYLLKRYNIKDKNYDKDISYYVEIPKEDISILRNYNYEIIDELYIKNSN